MTATYLKHKQFIQVIDISEDEILSLNGNHNFKLQYH